MTQNESTRGRFRSDSVAEPGRRAKNTAPPPKNGSKYRCPLSKTGSEGRRRGTTWLFPPAHFRNGLAAGGEACSSVPQLFLGTGSYFCVAVYSGCRGREKRSGPVVNDDWIAGMQHLNPVLRGVRTHHTGRSGRQDVRADPSSLPTSLVPPVQTDSSKRELGDGWQSPLVAIVLNALEDLENFRGGHPGDLRDLGRSEELLCPA
jgi:hypothetical protein